MSVISPRCYRTVADRPQPVVGTLWPTNGISGHRWQTARITPNNQSIGTFRPWYDPCCLPSVPLVGHYTISMVTFILSSAHDMLINIHAEYALWYRVRIHELAIYLYSRGGLLMCPHCKGVGFHSTHYSYSAMKKTSISSLKTLASYWLTLNGWLYEAHCWEVTIGPCSYVHA